MSKATNAQIAALKARFETGDIPDGTDFANALQLLQDAIQEHEHVTPGGGVDAGTGDAAAGDHGALTGLDDNDHPQYVLKTLVGATTLMNTIIYAMRRI